jgi:AraC family transcriptional activator of tynA and feaB
MLSPTRAARALGISERAVHLAMEEIEVSFMRYVRTARLECVTSALRGPDGQRRPIADIAFEFGFSDLSTFHRGFRERFDMTPRDYLRTMDRSH